MAFIELGLLELGGDDAKFQSHTIAGTSSEHVHVSSTGVIKAQRMESYAPIAELGYFAVCGHTSLPSR